MSITDELRKYAESDCIRCGGRKDLLDIADRIDVAHKRAIGYVDDRDPEIMAENGWGKLPKDANGKYICIGDIMEWPSGETFEVIGIGGDTLFYINDNDSMVADWTKASNKRHHKPTVKDVLRDVVTLCHNAWKEGSAFEFWDVDDVMNSGNIAYFAAKLQMRED